MQEMYKLHNFNDFLALFFDILHFVPSKKPFNVHVQLLQDILNSLRKSVSWEFHNILEFLSILIAKNLNWLILIFFELVVCSFFCR